MSGFDPYGNAAARTYCPACPNHVPMKREAGGLSCPRCRGKLYDRAGAEMRLSQFKLPPLPERDPARQRAFACSLCGGRMATHRAADGQVSLEICGTCAAAFVDFAEANKLAMAVSKAKQAAAAAMPAAAPAPLPRTAPSFREASSLPSSRPLIEPIEVPSGVGRLLFKLIPLLALALIGWRNQETARRLVTTVTEGPSSVMTSVDLGNVRNAVAAEVASTDRWPKDLETFLKANVSGVDPHLDRWGTPYELRGVPDDPAVASCGPDRACGTEDDLVVPMFRKKKPGEDDAGALAGIEE